MVVKTGRFGKFLACSNYPECKNTKKIASSKVSAAEGATPVPTGETCEKCGAPLVYRKGRFGPFIACSNYPKCRYTKKMTGTPEKEKEAKEENTTTPRAKKKE
jgi:DNA topoisomerase-1